ncbi:hypothetical protein LCGC14_1853880, partial [marine sediment metagenome]
GGGRAGFLGNNTSGNDDLYWKNEQGGNIGIETTGAGELQIFAPVDLNSNDLTTTGTVTGGGAKCQMTPIGGFAIKLTNTTGAVTVKGQIVKTDTTTDDAVVLTTAGDVECIGVFLDAGVADDAEAWVVVAGIADVAMGDNQATTHGNWVETNDAEAGYADATAASPAAAPAHFEEIGLCIETVAATGGGTHILARCVLHFN